MNYKINVTELNEYYKINILSEKQKMSTGYLVGMIIGFLFFLIIGIIMLVVWFTKNSNNDDVNVDIVVPRNDWKNELDKQLLVNNFGQDTDKIKLDIENKIQLLNK